MIMNINELHRLSQWIASEVVRPGVVEKYQDLHRLLEQHVSGSQPRPSFAEQRQQLISTLMQVPVERLSPAQQALLDQLGIAQAVGEQGAERVEDALYKNVIDVATSAQLIGDLLARLQKGIHRSDQIRSGLADMLPESEVDDESPVIMRIVFSGRAAMANVADFRRWGELWHDIGYGIAFANGETAEDVAIVGAASGSVVLDLGVSMNVATTASDIILSAMQLREKVQDINQKAEELRRLQLNNNKLILDLEREAEHAGRNGAETISAAVIKKLGLRKNGEGDKITALMKSVKHLIHFIDIGGDVDFVMPFARDAQQASDPGVQELHDLFLKIQQLKKKLHQQQRDDTITEAA